MSGGISGFFILTPRGEALISRIYRDDISIHAAHTFRLHVIVEKDVRSPVNVTRDATFLHIQAGGLYLMAATKGNINVAMAFELLYSIVGTLHSYFGEFGEDTIRKNTAILYELLDEILDFGYPQITSGNLLKEYIKGESKKSAPLRPAFTKELTGQNTFRAPNIMYKKNEIFIDVVEAVNLLVSKDGQRLSEDVTGKILLRCRLSGMPECKFGFNDKVQLANARGAGPREGGGGGSGGGRGRGAAGAPKGGRGKGRFVAIDDVTCHQCVKLTAFDKNREVQFTPPDGAFELMSYRTTSNLKMPFTVTPIVNEFGKTRVDYRIRVHSNYPTMMKGTNVVLLIPTPPNTARCKIQVAHGSAKYDPTQDCIVWAFKNFEGQTAFDLVARARLMTTMDRKEWSRPPIQMRFEVPTTATGIRVRFLRVVEHKMRYDTVKWVRYLTKAGTYSIRY